MLRRVALARTDVSANFITSSVANVVPSSLIVFTLMIEALRSFGTPVLTEATRRNIPENGILHSHRCENLKFHIFDQNRKQVECNFRSRNKLPVFCELLAFQ
jgi:hypothetical protein